jgi:uncharacterized secreted protein with C-terminal beta-propeller domain
MGDDEGRKCGIEVPLTSFITQLVVQGSVKDLGKGETIKSVRFLGDKGYVVTFWWVDLLYVIDFASSPPAIMSELQVSGFSDFMYPIKNGKFLLTVGNEADENGTLTGVKILVFNVTDRWCFKLTQSIL